MIQGPTIKVIGKEFFRDDRRHPGRHCGSCLATNSSTMSDFSIAKLRKLHDVACHVARIAGNYLREDQLRRRKVTLSTREKLSSVDLVTAADEGVEKIIK
jgi:hypothetical protein